MAGGKKIVIKTTHSLLDDILDLLLSGAESGQGCYIVGGVVRDAIMCRPSDDLDVVVEGKKNAFHLASFVSKKLKIDYTAHQRFGTYVFKILKGGLRLGFDIATARKEIYIQSASLPVVNLDAGIKDDLYRRDFTINAMAVPLAAIGKVVDQHSYKEKRGSRGYFFYKESIIDLFGGIDDLSGKLIRVLHNGSFEDDPTRIIRAARFAARFGFSIEDDTRRLASDKKLKDIIPHLSPARTGNEIVLLSSEKHPIEALKILDGLGVVKSFFPDINTAKFHNWIYSSWGLRHNSPADFLADFVKVMDVLPENFLNKHCISRVLKKEVMDLIKNKK